MSRKLNLAHYRAIKALFGISSVSLGEGGYARLLTLLGRSGRRSTKVGARIFTTLARSLALPPTTCISEVVGAVADVTRETWVEAARAVARSFQIQVVPTRATACRHDGAPIHQKMEATACCPYPRRNGGRILAVA